MGNTTRVESMGEPGARPSHHIRTTLTASDLFRTLMNGTAQPTYCVYGYSSVLQSTLLRFKGQLKDACTGNYLLGNGYRSFNPRLMRFASADTASPFAQGGINAYAFVQGDPVNYNDPTGHVPVAPITPPLSYTGKINVTHGIRLFRPPPLKAGDQPMIAVNAHGILGFIGRRLGRKFTARAFYELALKKGYDLKEAPIHLIACETANTSPMARKPFAQQLSNITKQPVVAYKGSVTTRESPLPPRGTKTFEGNVQVVRDSDYQPVTFYPDPTRQTRPIRTAAAFPSAHWALQLPQQRF